MTKACKEFRDTSEYIFNWFAAKQNVKEESFTDWFLYNLSQRLPIFKYVEFNRHEEGSISGADFDFWIIGKTSSISLRIQAKKLKRKGNHYDAIAYPSGTKSQINLLLSSSFKPFRPFYLFYNNDINSGRCSNHLSGTLLIDANEINSIFLAGGKTSVSRQDLLNISIPLECLFCCPLSGGDDQNRLSGVKSVIDTYFSQIEGENTGYSNSIPDFIIDIVNPDLNEEQWKEKYINVIQGNIRYVAVLDLRDENKNY